ncbi:cell division protein BolA [Saccharobesus litoralis]|uniref:Cell division protein BolA n=1 Tax=Saccharobesus litoralis TaxID=2172099 RepID=A0A2S0VX06_9ALTE|nr:BolA/IbaG family iron-sulfur metabolism protein [Saccharobesus litoralis]AWB68640.1 cell division protein BolA [Saccharobesus litoralis]
MDLEQIKQLLNDSLDLSDIQVKAEGSHLEIVAVSESFAGQRSLKRQQAIYAPLMDMIADGTIHAVAIKAFTEEEYRKHKLLNF